MKKEKTNNHRSKRLLNKISNKELAFYLIAGLIALAGLILVCFGIVSSNVNRQSQIHDADLAFAAKMKLPFRYWGLILFVVGVLVAVITLCVNAKKTDRIVEKEIRRQQRLEMMSEVEANAKPALNVVEVESKPKETDEEKK